MTFSDYKKETSEVSDKDNWAKEELLSAGEYFYESIEGCNQNENHQITLLMERVCVKCQDGIRTDSDAVVLNSIKTHEGEGRLIRLINFAKLFDLPLTYILYSYDCNKVWRYSISSIEQITFEEEYTTFDEFSDWIQKNKGWKSKKPYREPHLPEFDISLRNRGCAWPTNIDCIAFDKSNVPIAIIEFQNANKTKVRQHCNNFHFLFGDMYDNPQSGEIEYHDDVRRWMSQEILRVQSGLRLFIITWAKNDSDYTIKEVDQITFPNIPHGPGTYEVSQNIKSLYHSYINGNKEAGNYIASSCSSYNLSIDENKQVRITDNVPPLKYSNKTFPYLYYRFKETSFGYPNTLSTVFSFFIQNLFSAS